MMRYDGPTPTPSPSSGGDPAQAALAQIGNLGGVGGSFDNANSNDPVLYWGQSDNMSGQRARRERLGQPEPTTSDRYTTMSDAQQEFYRWSTSDRAAWGQYLLNLGLITADEATDYGTLQKQWASAIDEAVNFHAAGKQVNPWQAAALMAGQDNPGATTNSQQAATKAAGFTGTKKTHDTRVDLTDPQTAKALVNQVLSNQLGRNATDEEIRQFTAVLHNAENANPITQDTTSTYVNGENTATNTTTSGGLDSAGKAQVVTDAALQKPEYGAYQAATTYLSALNAAIKSPV